MIVVLRGSPRLWLPRRIPPFLTIGPVHSLSLSSALARALVAALV
jgi:hypothetical protein